MKTDYGFCTLGVDYSVPPTEQAQGMLADASNVLPTNQGLISSRAGQTKLHTVSLASRVTSFFEHTGSDGTRIKLATFSDKIALYDSGSGEFVTKISGLTSDKMFQWVNFGGKSICVNEGADAPQYVTDSTTYGALAGSPPNGKTVMEFGNRIWFGGDSTNPARLTGCALNDPTDYTTSGALGVVQETVGDSSDPITGIIGFFDWLVVGKQNNMFKMEGNPVTDGTSITITPIFNKSNDNIGFTSPWAITQVGKDLIFLDGYDIKSLAKIEGTGDVETTSIIPHFSEYLKSIVDEDYLQYTQFFHYKKRQQIWVSIPTGAATHFVFVLDYRFKSATNRYAFFPLSGIVANCFGGVANGATTDMFAGDETGFVRQLDTGTSDDGVAISSHFTISISGNYANSASGGELTFHERRKEFNHIEAFIQPTQATLTMTPSYALDLMDDTSVRTGTYTSMGVENVVGTWAGSGVLSERVRFYGVAGRTLALKWTHSTLGEGYIVHPSNVNWTPKTTVRII